MARVQLDLNPREMQRLEYIMETCDLSSRKELFSNAFTALEWMVGETRAGRFIFSSDQAGGDKHVLSLPALQNIEVQSNKDMAAPVMRRDTGLSAKALAAAQSDDEENWTEQSVSNAAS